MARKPLEPVERPRTDGDSSWQVRWRVGGGTGPVASETFSTREPAVEFAAAVDAADRFWPTGWVKGVGRPVPEVEEAVDPSVVTVQHVYDAYMEVVRRRMRRNKIQADQVQRYEGYWRNRLAPSFGEVPFVDVDDDLIDGWVDDMLEEGWQAKTILNWHGFFFSVMDHGRGRMKLRPDNPCTLTDLPEPDAGTEVRQVRFFTHGEWNLLRECLKSDVHLLVDVLLASGMRWGEVSALRVECVAFQGDDEAVLRIVRAWRQRGQGDTSKVLTDQGETKRWKLGPPKNKRSRSVVISGDVVHRLSDAISGAPGEAYVFRTKHGHPWRYPDFHFHRWSPGRDLAKEAGLQKAAKPHMLRHTYVVWQLADGVPLHEVSEALGHGSIEITYDIYGGLIDLTDPTNARRMAKAMAEAKTATFGTPPPREQVDAYRPPTRKPGPGPTASS
ncbi:tyrosine-type recombinase/integrase [Cellulomonas fimi]|uniref:tyrosine-type recombinase/integrase n=1 Tax=Cellulomonas fimi TaxID=1708 RepID=UPI0023596080|nr:site-specific integrase [Cellulomonas fimi]